MKKTLSLLLAVLMLMTLVVTVPAMAADVTDIQYVTTTKTADLSVFDDSAAIDDSNAAQSGLLKYAGVGTSAWDAPNADADGDGVADDGTTKTNFINMLNISDGSTNGSVTAETVDGEKVLKLYTHNTVSNVGIALDSIDGRALLAGGKFRTKFAFYQPEEPESANQIAFGLAKDTGNGLEYLEINAPKTVLPTDWVDTSKTTIRYAPGSNPGVGDMAGAVLFTYYQHSVHSPLLTYIRHNTSNGGYYGGGGWQMARATNLTDEVSQYGTDSADQRKASMGDWYYATVDVSYVKGVGLRYTFLTSMTDVELSPVTSGIVPMTSAEIAALGTTNFSPVITMTGYTDTDDNYIYVKNISQQIPTVYETTAQYGDVQVQKGTEGFEEVAAGTKNGTLSSAVSAFGVGGQGVTSGALGSHGTYDFTAVVDNPSHNVGNTSSKVLNLKATIPTVTLEAGKSVSTNWTGFRTAGIPSYAFTGSAEGVTYYMDVYNPTGSNMGNGRFYVLPGTESGTITGSINDSASADRVMAHVITGSSLKYYPTYSGGTFAQYDLGSAWKSDWQTVAINLYVKDGQSYIRFRVKDILTDTWGAWTAERSIPAKFENHDYWVFTHSFMHKIGSSTASVTGSCNFNLYVDNVRVEYAAPSTVPAVADANGAAYIGADSTVKVTMPNSVASLASATVTLKAGEDTVEAAITKTTVNGKLVYTIDPVDSLEVGAVYTVDFAGAKDVSGNAIVNPTFSVSEAAYSLEADTDLDGTLVLGETAYIAANGLTTDQYTVVSSSGAIVVEKQDDMYVLSVGAEGNTIITVTNNSNSADRVTYNVRAIKPTATATVTYVVEGSTDKTEIVAVNSVAEGYTPSGNGMFVEWQLDDGTSATGHVVTEDVTYTAFFDVPVAVTLQAGFGNTTFAEEVVYAPINGCLPAAPEMNLETGEEIAYWMIGDTKLTNDEFLSYVFEEDTTAVAYFKQPKMHNVNYDFTTMTAEEFALSGWNGIGTFTEGAGLELVKVAGYNTIYFAHNDEDKVFKMEYDFIQTSGTGGFDGFFRNSAGSEVQALYHTVGTIHDRNTSNGASGMSNLTGYANGKPHTLTVIFDPENDRHFYSLDGVSGVEAIASSEALRGAKAIPDLFTYNMKAGGSMILTGFRVEMSDSVSTPNLVLTKGKNVASVNFAGVSRTEKHIPAGDKVQVRATVNAPYVFDHWEIDGDGSLEDETSATTNFIAGTEDTTLTAVAVLPTYTITFDAGENGTITSGEAVQTVENGSLPVVPTVTANPGYTFAGWDKEIVAATGDVTYVAQYTQAETVEISFVEKLPNTVTVDETALAIKGGNIISLPTRTPIMDATFLYWEAEDGTRYTDDELLEVVFEEEATIKAVYKYAYANAAGVYDITKYGLESMFSVVGGNKHIGEEGELVLDDNSDMTEWVIPFKTENSGVYTFTIDFAMQLPGAASGDKGFNGSVKNSSNADLHSIFFQSAGTLYGHTNTNSPAKLEGYQANTCDGERHVIRYIFDLDNNVMFIELDGTLLKLPYNKAVADGDISKIRLVMKNSSCFKIYKIGSEKLDAAPYNVTIKAPEVNGGSYYAYNGGSAWEGQKALAYITKVNEGYEFLGWNVNGELIEDEVIRPVITEDTTIQPVFKRIMFKLTYHTTEHLTFEGVEGDTYVTPEFPSYTVPSATLGDAAVPVLVLEDGYEFVAWQNVGSEETYGYRTLADAGCNGSVLEVVAVVQPIQHTITFDVGKFGTTEDETTVVVGDGEVPTAPTVTPVAGYHFKGWDKEIVAATGDETYTAVYKQYWTVKFQTGENGTFADDENLQYMEYEYERGEKLHGHPTPVPNPGYEYTTNWIAVNRDGQPTLEYKKWFDNTGWTIDLVLEPEYKLIDYTITFDLGEFGTTEDETTVTAHYGDTVTAPQVTAIEGWKFSHWTPEIETVTGDATYTAVYEAVKYVAEVNGTKVETLAE